MTTQTKHTELPACNNHYQLLEACKEILGSLDGQDTNIHRDGVFKVDITLYQKRKLEQAINQAEGKKAEGK